MATPKEVAEVSAQQDKPKSLIQDKSVLYTTKETGTFLETRDLAQFRNTALFAARACEAEMEKRKLQRLLQHVFNADPKKVEEFLNQTIVQKERILDKTSFREGYDSENLNKFVCFRHWKSVSALQAAALCGDEFLVLDLLKPILELNVLNPIDKIPEYLETAIQQLEELDKRTSDHSILLEAIDFIINAVQQRKMPVQKFLQSDEIQSFIRTYSDDQQLKAKGDQGDSKASVEQKSQQEERKIKTEDSQLGYADQAEFLDPVVKLLIAYTNFFIHKVQTPTRSYHVADPETDLDRLCQIIAQCQKNLSNYVKLEIFDIKPFSIDPLPNFESPPKRGECCYMPFGSEGTRQFPLDLLGANLRSEDGLVIFKSDSKGISLQNSRGTGELVGIMEVATDLASMTHLYKLRKTGLKNIIERLQKLLLAHQSKDKDVSPSSKPKA